MVGARRELGLLSRSVALRRLCRIFRRALSTAGRGRGLAKGLHRFLGTHARAHPRKKYLRHSSQRCRPALDGAAFEFSAHGKWLPERNLSKGRLRFADAAFHDVDHSGPDGDKAFIAMMHDFVESHRERPATTESFKAVAEKHMTKAMDIGGNGSLDWFFAEWVYGTQVPRYKFEYQLAPADGGRVKLHMTVTQSDVDAPFAMLVPVFADFGKGMIRLGQIAVVGNNSSSVDTMLPIQPKKVALDPYKEILQR